MCEAPVCSWFCFSGGVQPDDPDCAPHPSLTTPACNFTASLVTTSGSGVATISLVLGAIVMAAIAVVM